MSGRRRNLTPEDRELWGRVVQTARPLHKRAPLSDPMSDPLADLAALNPNATAKPAAGGKTRPSRVPAAARTLLKPNPADRPGQHDLSRPLSEALAQSPVQMDKRQFQRMSRGKLEPEARIDLHGMTLAQAHGALNSFILRAQSAGLRLVLVITGKGKTLADDGPIPRRQGALKQDVPHWLRMAPLKSAVLELREAHARHGGSGAYYVYLRRAR
ncbi:MAG: Smr/MutS family protein [Roseinatronobacter sp.]